MTPELQWKERGMSATDEKQRTPRGPRRFRRTAFRRHSPPWAESTLGTGSIFTFTLPVAHLSVPATVTATVPMSRPRDTYEH